MSSFVAEFFGTAILVLLGNGVVANVVLDNTKGHNSGWIVITAGWAFAVFSAVVCTAELSGAHLNPAVTVGLAVNGQFDWVRLPGYITAQILGAVFGAIVVYVYYYNHYEATSDADAKLATFCTSPAIRNLPLNFCCEAIGTAVLVLAVLSFSSPALPLTHEGKETLVKVGLGSVGAIQVAMIVFSIGLSLGGTTGYGVNPARDLGPRLAHAFLPIRGKRDSDWGYAFVPFVGPLVGAILAVGLFQLMRAA
ncbi:MIP/aquaporin family protein [Schlesneria paludicola]|uniref:MIP/aquaporin family protein n=1 Tax=Schlesneria paludicola TaxID=360056 RepID=UPI000299F329|nr:MIP/aquaporin family protein [Schlesneria paludicola]